jgi:hypothetical protein
MSLIHEPNDIKELVIADGLKELLIEYGFTVERLRRLSTSDLACILRIDGYVAKIILNAAKEQVEETNETMIVSDFYTRSESTT